VILLGIPGALIFAILAGIFCRIRQMTSQQAKPYILWSAFTGFLLGAFGPLALSFWAWASGLIGAR